MDLRFCLFFCLPIVAYSSLFESPAGRYWFTVDSFEKCSKEGTKEMIIDFHLRKMNRTTVILYGNISFKHDFDDSMKMRSEFSQWGNGGWRSNIYNLNLDKEVCKHFYTVLGNRVENFMAKAGVAINKTNCVIPANNYQVDNIVVSNSFIEAFPILIFGKYRATSSLYSARDKLLGCFKMLFGVVRRY